MLTIGLLLLFSSPWIEIQRGRPFGKNLNVVERKKIAPSKDVHKNFTQKCPISLYLYSLTVYHCFRTDKKVGSGLLDMKPWRRNYQIHTPTTIYTHI